MKMSGWGINNSDQLIHKIINRYLWFKDSREGGGNVGGEMS